jgi:hypothetical protein
MRYHSILFISALAGGFVLQAQENYNQRKNTLLAEAARMSEAGYAFKATPEVGAFASRVARVADAQMMISTR